MSESMTVKELITVWGFKVDEHSFQAVEKSLEKFKQSIEVVGAVALGEAFGLFELVKSAGEVGEQAKKTAERLGIGVEALQEYQFAADLAGVSNDEMATSLRKLNINLGEAKAGVGEAKTNLYGLSKLLGYDVVRSGKNAEDLLLDIADAFEKTTDVTKKAAISQQVFGRSSAGMVNLLNKGGAALRAQRAEARELGVVMSEEDTAAAEEFIDSLKRLYASFRGLRNIVAVGFFPVLTKLADRFREWVVANREFLKLKIDKYIEIFNRYTERALWLFGRMGHFVNVLVEAFGGWEHAIELVTTAMLVLLGVRFLAFIGNVIMMLGRAVMAFRLLGSAGLIAQLEIAAIPIAIGAAFVALILIIEDVVAYFQGRKSLTGIILNNFDGLADKLFAQFDAISEKATAFAKKIAESITNYLLDIDEEKIKKLGELILKVLDLALITGGLALKLGIAIGEAIVDGIESAMRTKAPALARLIFGEDLAKDAKFQAAKAGMAAGDSAANINQNLSDINAKENSGGVGKFINDAGSKIFSMLGGKNLDDLAAQSRDLNAVTQKINEIKSANQFPDVPPTPGAKPTGDVNVTAPITIVVPEGTAPEKVGPMARAGVRDSLDSILRESGRASKPAVAY